MNNNTLNESNYGLQPNEGEQRLPYNAPTLSSLGSIQSLVQNASGTGMDGGSGDNSAS